MFKTALLQCWSTPVNMGTIAGAVLERVSGVSLYLELVACAFGDRGVSAATQMFLFCNLHLQLCPS